MDIQGINHANASSALLRDVPPHEPTDASTQGSTGHLQASGSNQAVQVEPTSDGEPEPAMPSGLLRLMQQGHFQGVADLQHRIQYDEQISALEDQATAENVASAIDGIIEAVDTQIEGLTAEQQESIADAKATFDSAVRAVLGDFVDSFVDSFADSFGDSATPATPSEGGGITEVRAAFETLEADLQAILNPTEPNEPLTIEGEATAADAPVLEGEDPANAAPVGVQVVDGEPSNDPVVVEDPAGTTETTFDAQAFFTALSESFESEFAVLSEAYDTQILPPIAEPVGHGSAYDKFLAIYQQLQGVVEADAADEPSAEEASPLDTVA